MGNVGDPEVNGELDLFLKDWKPDPQDMKAVFIRLKERLLGKPLADLSFESRPGISYSLRAGVRGSGKGPGGLFALIDVVDDDPWNRWLSVCFYEDMITDPEGAGNLIPEGLLGKDGFCFDLDGQELVKVSYIEKRIDEAYEHGVRKYSGLAQG